MYWRSFEYLYSLESSGTVITVIEIIREYYFQSSVSNFTVAISNAFSISSENKTKLQKKKLCKHNNGSKKLDDSCDDGGSSEGGDRVDDYSTNI